MNAHDFSALAGPCLKLADHGRSAGVEAIQQLPRAAFRTPATVHDPSSDTSAPSVRWSPGERLENLFEDLCDKLALTGEDTSPAAITAGGVYSFRDLDNRANQAARYLRERGVRAGDRVALLLDRSFDTYVALLAVQKLRAAYVPLDKSFPNDRIAFILEDAGARAIISQEVFRQKLTSFQHHKVFIDSESQEIDRHPSSRLQHAECDDAPDQLSYIIYTSGTTGKPKGVAIDQASICNFVRVAAETYGIEKGDRVYQGMTIAFDFSVEELWVPLVAGATLVPASPGTNLIGEDLAIYLRQNRITVMCCVPTLLASIESDLPDLRLLLVSGEACPQNLVDRWYQPGRTILNAYGPTEATVTATLTELYPGKPVTIGKALPTYTIVMLHETEDKLVAHGETGEIGIAGIGLARGYLNRDDLTSEKFIPDFAGLPDNPSKRIYRTGDLGRFNSAGEIEYFGRIDTQVKIRGYRIELTEIESLILQDPTVAQAVVSTFEVAPGHLELVAYCSPRSRGADIDREQILNSLREHLPPYMVPAYLERLDVIPMSTSNKADRKSLPPPTGPRCQASGPRQAPRNQTERLVASALAETLKLTDISVHDDFFDDLGAHSLLMARFCSAIRARITCANVSMRDVYAHPSVEKLARKLDSQITVAEAAGQDEAPYAIPSFLQYCVCGVLQLLTYIVLTLGVAAAAIAGVHWGYAAIGDAGELFRRVLLFVLGFSTAGAIAPVLAKWHLVGRWKPEYIRIWSIAYFRFWFVKLLYDLSPLHLFAGTPLYNAWLRLLGARIGRHAVILSKAPVTTDLFTVGAGSIVRENTMTPGYRAHRNVIETGMISIGADAYVGTGSHLEIDTFIEDGGQLAYSSTLQKGQTIAAGMHFHGTPAVETQTNFNSVEPRRCSSLRRWVYSCLVAAGNLLLASVPIVILFYSYLMLHAFSGARDLNFDEPLRVLAELAPSGAWLSLVIYIGMMMLGIVFLRVVPPVLNCFLRTGRTYVLFGFHHVIQRLVQISTNWGYMNLIFGDSRWIPGFLKLAGWKIAPGRQTGSNFGLDQVHDNPYMCHIGANTMVSDGIVMSNAELSATSFSLSDVKIGADNYLGNTIVVPSGNRTGNNVLIGTRTMIPIDGPLRENTGLLGSPAFEIPRITEADRQAASNDDPASLQERLSRKSRVNLATMCTVFLSHWFASFIAVFVMFVSILYYERHAAAAILAGIFTVAVFGIAFFTLLERASLGFGSLKARNVTMYDPYFLFHERHWKFCGHPLNSLFHGTPLRNLMSRALGVRVGKMVFDDGANLYDKTLLEIGDFANLNKACILQGHSLEEGLFKSDAVRIGNECTVGSDAFVHYGVEMRNGSTLAPNAFLMKGETVPPGQTWQGNPASLGAVKSRPAATPDIATSRRPARYRQRSAEDRRRTARTVPWRRTPEPQPTVANAMAGGATAERRRIAAKIMTPANRRPMFNGRNND